ncbi:MAG: chromate transporter [Beijerinckiaceae bacterium]
MSVASDSESSSRHVGLLELASGFLLIGLLGFGGLAASGLYVIVERNRWLDRREYVEMFGVCSVLPGGNILNLSIVLGDRFQGPLGSIVAISSLMLAPLAILMGVAVAYEHFSYLPEVKAASAGAASAIAGMTMGSAAKLVHGLSNHWTTYLFAALTFAAIALLHLPLAAVVLAMAPLAVAVALLRARRARTASRTDREP